MAVIRLFNLITAFGVLAVARGVGKQALSRLGFKKVGWGLDLGVSAALGLALVSVGVHGFSYLGLFRFWPLAVLFTGLSFWTAPTLIADFQKLKLELKRSPLYERLTLLFLRIPICPRLFANLHAFLQWG